MKGKLSLGDFISRVRNELAQAQDTSGKPFFQLTNVELEVSFVLDASAKATGDLFVVELSGQTKAQQTHKVKLTLEPLLLSTYSNEAIASESVSPTPASIPATATATEGSPDGDRKASGGGGGGGLLEKFKPVYAPPPKDRLL